MTDQLYSERIDRLTSEAKAARMRQAMQESAALPAATALEQQIGASSWPFNTRQTAVRLFLTCWIIYVLHFSTNIVREVYPAITLGDATTVNVYEYKDLHPDIFQPDPGVKRAYINNNPGASIMGAVPYALASPLINRISDMVQRKRAETAPAGAVQTDGSTDRSSMADSPSDDLLSDGVTTNGAPTDIARTQVAPPNDAPQYESPWPMAREFYQRVYERGLDVKLGLAAAVMQTTVMAPLSALAAVLMFVALAHRTGSRRTGVALAVLFAFATPVFFRTGQLNQNLIVCHCGLIAFTLLWQPWNSPEMPRRPSYFLVGLICGWAVVCDYSGLVLVAVLSWYGLFKWAAMPRTLRYFRDPFVYAIGLMASGVVLAWYQWAAFGSPLWPAQHYMPDVLHSDQGYRGFDWPQLDLAWATGFDFRFGLFTSAPILLLALWLPAWRRRGGRLIGRMELVCAVAIVIGFWLFCSANQFGRMQFNSGVRHIVPVIPFMFLLAAGALIRMPRLAAAVIAGVSLYWSWCLAMHREVEIGFGIFDAVARVTFGGLELPWLTTMKRMSGPFSNYVGPETSPATVLIAAGLVIFLMWWIKPRNRPVKAMARGAR